MKASELRDLDTEVLRQKEAELKKSIMEMRFNKALGKLDSPAAYKALRKDLARVKTILRERALAEERE